MAPQRQILVDPADVEVRHEAVSGLPVVNAVLSRIGLDRLVESYRNQSAGGDG